MDRSNSSSKYSRLKTEKVMMPKMKMKSRPRINVFTMLCPTFPIARMMVEPAKHTQNTCIVSVVIE